MRASPLAIALTLAAGCASTAEPSRDDWVQAVAEARARAASLERTVERLERELAETRTAAAPVAALATAQPPAAPPPCAATTAGGSRCKRAARAGELYCWQHAPELRGTDAPADPAAPQ